MWSSIFLLVFSVCILIFGPLAFIWAMNTLFPLNIAYDFDTWLASLILVMIFGPNKNNSQDK